MTDSRLLEHTLLNDEGEPVHPADPTAVLYESQSPHRRERLDLAVCDECAAATDRYTQIGHGNSRRQKRSFFSVRAQP